MEPSGIAVDFWNRYEEHLDRAAALGCDMFRLGLEWARVQPEQGRVDSDALDRYAAILDACTERGMEPLVTLHHFTHPSWLGDDFWLSSESPDIYASWVRLAVDRLGDKCRKWITLNEINIVGFTGYLVGAYPPGRNMAIGDFHLCSSHMLAAHVKGYEIIHDRSPESMVTTNNSTTSVYEHDRLFTDVLLAKASGVARSDVASWLTSGGRGMVRLHRSTDSRREAHKKGDRRLGPDRAVQHRDRPFQLRPRAHSDRSRGRFQGGVRRRLLEPARLDPRRDRGRLLRPGRLQPRPVARPHDSGRALDGAGQRDLGRRRLPARAHTYIRANLECSEDRQTPTWRCGSSRTACATA